MWIVRLTEQRTSYGPIADEQEAYRFAAFLSAEVDPAEVERLYSPTAELLNWRDAVHSNPGMPGGPNIGHALSLIDEMNEDGRIVDGADRLRAALGETGGA